MSTAASAGLRHRHHHALAGGEAVGLDHDWHTLRTEVGFCFLCVGEVFIGGGRNVIGAAQRFGKVLRAFQLPRGLGRPECLEADGVEVIDDAGRDRRVRSHHHEVNFA